ncbi:MAG: hypothetical protein JWR10_4518 [Rubritepida sp.]|nr:hypothetical protein [Rubritepida sp.]
MSDNVSLLEGRIREKAYRLWQDAGSPDGQEEDFWHRAKTEVEQEEKKLDKELADSFPASDPPSTTGVTGPKRRKAPR